MICISLQVKAFSLLLLLKSSSDVAAEVPLTSLVWRFVIQTITGILSSMENGIPVYLEGWWLRRWPPGRRRQQRTSNCQLLSDFLVLKKTIFTKTVIKSNRLSVFCFRSHEKVWLSFKQKLLISQGKFYRCFGVRVPPRIKE